VAAGIMVPMPPRTRAQQIGDQAEDLVATRLADAGWRVLARRVRVGRLELDLCAVDPGPPPALVAVEVRWRSRRDFGIAEETVDGRKLARLRAAFGRLLEAGTLPDGSALPALPARLDVVVVEPSAEPAGPPRVRHHRGVG
jgi:Holliday junction resolvase-like predicted endonuclease